MKVGKKKECGVPLHPGTTSRSQNRVSCLVGL
jgi:hypothetical protein